MRLGRPGDGRPRIPLRDDAEKAVVVVCVAIAAVGGVLASLMADGSGGLPAEEAARPAAVTASALPPCGATPGGDAGVPASLATDAGELTGPCADTAAEPVRATSPAPRARPRQGRGRASPARPARRAQRRAAGRRRPAATSAPAASATLAQRRPRPAVRPRRGTTPPQPGPVAPAPAIVPPPPPVAPPPAAATAPPRKPVAPPQRPATAEAPPSPAPRRPASPPPRTPFDDSG